MRQCFKILMFLGINTLLFSCGIIKTETYLGKIENLEYQNTYFKTRQYEGVIFDKVYDPFGISNSGQNKFTPTISEIVQAEKVLKNGIKEINKNRPNQFGSCPVIHRNLSKYKRQYFGYIENNEKVIWVNCFWDKEGIAGFIDRVFYKEHDENWKTEERVVFDGCSYYWSIKINLNKITLFEFGVNGPA